MEPLDSLEPAADEVLRQRARELGREAAEHPVVARLKRLEEIIREDSALSELWAELEAFDTSSRCGSGGCGSGGCGSGGCGPEASDSEAAEAPKGNRLDLYARFSEEPILQEYVQVRHRFYVLVDSMVETMFENLYGQPWRGSPEVHPVPQEPAGSAVGFAGVSLVDILPD